MGIQETGSGRYCQMYVERKCRRLRKIKSHLPCCNHIAVWDVLAGCEIRGADDSSIRNPKPNDMNLILKEAPIQAIFATGQKAHNCTDAIATKIRALKSSACLPQALRTAG